MRGICPNVTLCPIYAYYNRNEMREMMRDYCLGDMGRCKRKQLRDMGQPVPLAMMPDGSFLSAEEAATLNAPSPGHTVI